MTKRLRKADDDLVAKLLLSNYVLIVMHPMFRLLPGCLLFVPLRLILSLIIIVILWLIGNVVVIGLSEKEVEEAVTYCRKRLNMIFL